MAIRTPSEHSVRMAIHFFVNFNILNGYILLTIGSIYNKLGVFVNLGQHFMTMRINSCVCLTNKFHVAVCSVIDYR